MSKILSATNGHKNLSTLTLNNGKPMPLVGHGLWKIPNENVADHVYNAIKAGYRLFDGACDYGNEVEAGQGVTRAIADGLVQRSDLFIVSKLWNTFHEKDRVEPICRKQLSDWGLEYFDLYIMHFPIAMKYVDPKIRYPPGWFDSGIDGTQIIQSSATIRDTWEAMESLVEKNLVKSIGTSNFNCASIMDLLRYAIVRPATLQIEYHPYLVQQALVDYAQSEGITVTAYSSFGLQGYVEMDLEHAVKTPHLFQNETVRKVAEVHGRVAVIPKSDSESMLKKNLHARSFDLTEDEIKSISALNCGLRFNDPLVYFGCLPIFA
ncbi:NAD(P)H-dependent D-xylose reductase xyl1 [Hyphodiscus hymeniophilus]|uniref:NAD(P)H-dependent D-xylose reductase xyl1 n=1 Tax=Hyphodiscus hymeniophilus TaxID=353542 RepID=A0A9P7AY39_9HELO|nr:NAD(P)H-dependent D-xylose reductase xyl1 [Hyphodiscus hymeniophilus]